MSWTSQGQQRGSAATETQGAANVPRRGVTESPAETLSPRSGIGEAGYDVFQGKNFSPSVVLRT